MEIELRSSNVAVSSALQEHTNHRITFATRRFADKIGRIVVRLVDLNGPRGGLDKRCRITAHLVPSGTILVEATEGNPYIAVSQAALMLDDAIARGMDRLRARAPSARRVARRLWRARLALTPLRAEPT
jgi:putative sigma-54 modulation protein